MEEADITDITGQPRCHTLVMLSWRTGERKSCSSEAKQNLPKILTIGARDQAGFTGETSAVVVVGNIAGPMGAGRDDEKCG